jgi:lipoprotein-anchoring transpeptidase ErfK/SrfK
MRKLVALLAVVPIMAGLTACGDKDQSSGGQSQGKAKVPLNLAVTPGENAKNLPVSTEIGTNVSGGKITEVKLTEGSNQLTGRLRDDGSAWVPDKPLKYKKTYNAVITATGQDGTTQTKNTTFTTMGQPENRVATSFYLKGGGTYGVALPLAIEFDSAVPKDQRAAVEKRLFVTTDPPQPGVWAWFNDKQVLYRGEQHWKPGTKISVRTALEGLPIGKGFGDKDNRVDLTITDKVTQVNIDNGTKRMYVYQNNKLLKTLPVSLGKESTPSSSGNMVIMEKAEYTVFNTMSDPDPANRYIAPVEFAQRLTWGGEYIHAAPWSVGDQGYVNVSHGCVNMSTENAQWLFSITKVGDPVNVKGTGIPLEVSNGWNVWNVSWPEFIKRSALPHPELAKAAAQTSPSPSQQPSTQPSTNPTTEPSTEPTTEPSTEPSTSPSTEPTPPK